MNNKDNDLLLNMLANPDFTLTDFETIGLNADNTGLDTPDYYKNNTHVQEAFKTPNGNFDEAAFNKAYNSAAAVYNVMATQSYDKIALQQASFHRDNILAAPEQRRKGPDITLTTIPNPMKQQSGIITLGKTEAPTMSIDEIAQTQKVWDPSSQSWHDSPNDSFFTDFFDTRVLAQWDEEGEHIDPITGETVHHEKYEPKLNDQGYYYYENLAGRDIYGRRVLNKMNTLTTDGSFWNKYDFFDSDDIQQKSVGGTLLKNLVLVGSMFLPYVGPWIAGASVAVQGAGLLATLGKMTFGSDSPNLSAIEGWVNSVNRQTAKTDYAQEHTWCWENFINLVGDVAGQLKEQRFLFEKTPAIFKGTTGTSLAKQKKYVAEIESELNKNITSEAKALMDTKSKELLAKGKNIIFDESKALTELRLANHTKAAAELDSYMKGYNKLGSIISKAYMTGITVKDSYGEAKLAGATDLEATMLSLGYAAGEYWILNTGIGEHILPELRAEKAQIKSMVRALRKAAVGDAVQTAQTTTEKLGIVKKLFKAGRDVAIEDYTTGKKLLPSIFAHALGEGTEEVSEELLADVSKSCFNVAQWLQGDDTRMSAWDNMGDRYGMSFFGGLIGGGINAPFVSYKAIKSGENMTYNQAMQEVIYMARNGNTADLHKAIDKYYVADKNLSANKTITDSDGNIIPAPAENYEDSQDYAIKQAMHKQVKLIEDLLQAEGANISDESFLNRQTLKDLRFSSLTKSVTAGRFLQEFNNVNSQIINLTQELNNINPNRTDRENRAARDRESEGRETAEDITIENKRKRLEEQLTELRKRKDDLLNGNRSAEFIQDSLFEMIPAINQLFTKPTFIQYAEHIENKKIDEIPEGRLNELKEQYAQWKNTEAKDQIHFMADLFTSLVRDNSNMINTHVETFKNQTKEALEFAKTLNNLYSQLNVTAPITEGTAWQDNVQNLFGDSYKSILDILNIQAKDKINALKTSASEQENLITEDYNKNIEQAEQNYKTTVEVINKEYKDAINSVNNDSTIKEEDKETAKQELSKNYDARLKEVNDVLDNEKLQLSREYGETISQGLKSFKADVLDVLVENINDIIDPILKQGFVNSEIRNNLLTFIDSASNRLNFKDNDYYNSNPMDFAGLNNPYPKLQQELQEKKRQLKELPHSPIEEQLNQFSLATTGKPFKITELFDTLQTLLNAKKSDISEFNITGDIRDQLTEALNIVELYKSIINAVKTDNVGFGTSFKYNNEVIDASDLWGYSKTLNEVNEKQGNISWQRLAEIDSDTANLFLQDLDLVANKLQFFKSLYAINQGQKLNQQTRVALNLNYNTFNKISKMIVTIPDDWDGKQELTAAINSLEDLRDLAKAKNFNLTEEQKESVERQRIQMEDALYDFFEKNKAKLNNVEELKKFINPKNFNMFTRETTLLNEDTTDLDDNSFIWWLAARAAVKSSQFYGIFKNSISEQIAPIPTQEMAVYLNFANIVNGDVFTKFVDAYGSSMVEYFGSLDKAGRKKIIDKLGLTVKGIDLTEDPNFLLQLQLSPLYSNIVLTEGIPGSGKTNGVYQSLIHLLKTNYPELLKNSILCHGANEDSGKKLKDDTDFTEAKVMGRESLMKYISNDWHDFPKDSNGMSQVEETDFTYDNGIIHSNWEINALTDVPKIIMIDEISKFNNLEMDLLNKFARKYGVTIITAGDFDQSTATGQFKLEYKGREIPMTLESNRLDFIRAMKLGVSMRTTNSQKNTNLINFLAFVETKGKQDLKLHYYQDENGIYGEKYYNTDASGLNDALLKQVLADIDLMISTNKEKKVGYIYYSKDTKLYKALSDSKYADKIELFYGGSAQGLEGEYYIVESNPAETNLKDLYTGFTRSKKGSLIIGASQLNGKAVYSVRDKVTMEEGYSPEAIKKYANNRKTLLDKILTDPTSVTYNPRTSEEPVSKLPTTESEEGLEDSVEPPTTKPTPSQNTIQNTEEVTSEEESTNNTEPDETSSEETSSENEGSVSTEITKSENGEQSNEEQSNEYLPIDPTGGIKNEVAYKKQIDSSTKETVAIPKTTVSTEGKRVATIQHSFNCLETGVTVDENGNVVQFGEGKFKTDRIDSINGLLNLDKRLNNPVLTYQDYLTTLGNIRSKLLSVKDKHELVTKISQLLGIDDVYLTFALKTTVNTSERSNEFGFDNENYARFAKSNNEKLPFIHSNDAKSKDVKRTQFVAIIGNEELGDVLEVPLFVPTSPLTMMQLTIGDELVFPGAFDVYNNTTGNMKQKLDAVINTYESNPNYTQLIDAIKVFQFTGNGIFYLDKFGVDNWETWTPASGMEQLGPQFAMSKGSLQTTEGLDYDAEWVDIVEFAKDPSVNISPILTAKRKYIDGYDKPVVQAGHPFVLVSYDKSILDLGEYYAKQFTDPENYPKKVKLVYVLPPKVGIKEYIDNKYNIINQKGTNARNIGNLFTSYHILNQILFDDSFKQAFPQISDKTLNFVKAKIEQLNNIQGADAQQTQANLLGAQSDWTSIGHSQESLSRQFDNFLKGLVYVNQNSITGPGGIKYSTENLQKLESLVAGTKFESIYYTTKIPPTEKLTYHGPFIETVQDKNWSVNGSSYQIHGKVDSPAFRCDLSRFFHNVVTNKMKTGTKNGKTYKYSLDNKKYNEERNSNLSKSTKKSEEYTQEQKDTLAKVLKLPYADKILQGVDIKSENALIEIASKINKEGQNVAIVVDNKLHISTDNSIFKNKEVYLQTNDGGIISKLDDSVKTLTGSYEFKVKTIDSENNTVEYNASFENGNLTLTEIVPETNTTSTQEEIVLDLNDNEVLAFKDLAEEIPDEVDGGILREQDSLDDLIDSLEYDLDETEKTSLKNWLTQEISNQADGSINKQVCEKLLNYLNSEQTEEESNASCPIPITIKF